MNLYEVFEGDMTYYMVIDIMEGKTLQDELEIMKVNNVIVLLVKERKTLHVKHQDHNEGAINWGSVDAQ